MKKKKEKISKVKRKRKTMSNMNKLILLFLATIIIYLTIILPIRFCVVTFSWHWFVFGLIAIIIPYAFIYFQFWSQKKLAFNETQQKNANVVTVKFILYFWYLDCLYMTIFNQWKLWIYILGLITIIKIFYSLTVAFLGKKQKNKILDISLVVDFLLGVGLTVYLIYLIPDKFANLQTIVATIVAAVYGGLLTLVGVAWTIKHSDKQKREDELAKAKPMFTFNMVAEQSMNIHQQKICLICDDPETELLEMKQHPNRNESYMELENSNNASFIINRFFYDKSWHKASANNTVLPHNKILIQLSRKDIIEHPIMEIEDIYGRRFYYDLMFICFPKKLNPNFYSLSELKEISLENLQIRKVPLE